MTKNTYVLRIFKNGVLTKLLPVSTYSEVLAFKKIWKKYTKPYDRSAKIEVQIFDIKTGVIKWVRNIRGFGFS